MAQVNQMTDPCYPHGKHDLSSQLLAPSTAQFWLLQALGNLISRWVLMLSLKNIYNIYKAFGPIIFLTYCRFVGT